MTESDWQDMALLALSWLGYFALHSALASLRVKSWVAMHYPERMPLYRLSFNVLAVLMLLPILWLLVRNPGPTLWAWQGLGAWLSNGLALAALFGFMKSLNYYDTQEFLGLRQWKSHTRRVEDQEGFHLSPFHRYVRHPWYSFGLVLIWTRDMNAAMLLSGVMMTVYFIIGSRLEEKKLVVYHGDVYRRYMERVPGLIPLPWKSLTAKEAAELVKAAERTSERP
ncbi:MAG: methyltransferase family protein [Sulfuricella sp.]